MPAVRVTPANLALLALITCAASPRLMAAFLFACFRLLFGTLYPAYRSYKAVRTKNVKEYVKWMMYWIVFALFTVLETFADVIMAFWFPFYYEIKIILVVWLLSPVTRGSSILYRKFVHPQLERREAEIDEYIARATEQGYTTVFRLGMGGLNYAGEFLAKTAMQGGGTLFEQMRRSYSMNNLNVQAMTAPQVEGAPRQRVRAVTLTEADEVDSLQMAPMEADMDEYFMDDPPLNMLNNNIVEDNSDSDAGGSPTQSSGYGSVAAVTIKTERMSEEVEPLPRTRSKTRTGAVLTKKKTTSANQDYSANTLPRTKKTIRKRIPTFDQ